MIANGGEGFVPTMSVFCAGAGGGGGGGVAEADVAFIALADGAALAPPGTKKERIARMRKAIREEREKRTAGFIHDGDAPGPAMSRTNQREALFSLDSPFRRDARLCRSALLRNPTGAGPAKW